MTTVDLVKRIEALPEAEKLAVARFVDSLTARLNSSPGDPGTSLRAHRRQGGTNLRAPRLPGRFDREDTRVAPGAAASEGYPSMSTVSVRGRLTSPTTLVLESPVLTQPETLQLELTSSTRFLPAQ